MHWPADVLDVLLSVIAKRVGELSASLVENLARHRNAAGFRQRLEPSGDIDPVSINAGLVLEDIAEVDSDAKEHHVCRQCAIASFRTGLLHSHCAFDSADGAREFGENAIAGRIDYLAAEPLGKRNERRPQGLEAANRSASSCPIKREKPTTSATRIAARWRVEASTAGDRRAITMPVHEPSSRCYGRSQGLRPCEAIAKRQKPWHWSVLAHKTTDRRDYEVLAETGSDFAPGELDGLIRNTVMARAVR